MEHWFYSRIFIIFPTFLSGTLVIKFSEPIHERKYIETYRVNKNTLNVG